MDWDLERRGKGTTFYFSFVMMVHWQGVDWVATIFRMGLFPSFVALGCEALENSGLARR